MGMNGHVSRPAPAVRLLGRALVIALMAMMAEPGNAQDVTRQGTSRQPNDVAEPATIHVRPMTPRGNIDSATGASTRPELGQIQPEGQPAKRITDLVPIPLQLGPNHIARFAPDGREGNVFLAWHDEGGGRGHDIFLVTVPNKRSGNWRAVGLLQDGNSSQDVTITDDPNRGDDMLRSIRFARGKVDGENATLLLTATRADNGNARASSTTYEVYRLMQIGGRDGFKRIASRLLPDWYCNADMALSVASGLPLRSSYRGPRDVDGSFTKDGCHDPGVALLSSPSGKRPPLAGPQESSLSEQQKEKLFEQFLEWRSAANGAP